jgi:hypothetical protein
VSDAAGSWSAVLVADRCESLGVSLWELRLQKNGAHPDLDHASLSDWADRISGSSSALDALGLVELDRPRGVAQLRSQSPTQQDDSTLYYEVLLSRRGSLTLHRYQAGPDGRQEVPFVLTHQSLASLAANWSQASESGTR